MGRTPNYPGKLYTPRVNHLKLNITYVCDRGCFNCNRSTRLAPSDGKDDLSPEQVEHVLNESVRTGKAWTRITLTGGEPTMHPRFEEIVSLLMEYKHRHNPDLRAGTYTYHHPLHFVKVIRMLEKYPDLIVKDTSKDKPRVHRFPFYLAPVDEPRFQGDHRFGGCNLVRLCGLGYEPSGFYCCSLGAGISRIFGLDIGIRKIEDLTIPNLQSQYRDLCSRCGFYSGNVTGKARDLLSPTWKDALDAYRRQNPCRWRSLRETLEEHGLTEETVEKHPPIPPER